MLLKSTTETLELTTSSAANIDYDVTFADTTATSFLPASVDGKISTATTTVIVGAPAAGTTRSIKMVSITNRHASLSSIITVKKDIAGTEYSLCPAVTLAVGESLQFLDDEGWIYYGVTGAIRPATSATGSNGHVQVNNNNVLAYGSGVTWDSTANELAVTDNDSNVLLKAVTNEPSLPLQNTVHIYSKAVVGKMQLKIKGPSGLDTPLQASLWTNNSVLWMPNSSITAGFNGTSGSFEGTTANVLPTLTNLYTAMRRATYASNTTANLQQGIRTENMFFIGSVAGLGGFLFVCRFGLAIWTAGDRLFVGLSSGNTAITTGQPSALNDTIGFIIDAGDTAITFYHNDTTGGIKETIAGQPALVTNNGYDAYIWCAPNGSTIYYRLDNSLTGQTLIDSSVTTKIPTATAMLSAACLMGNAANAASAGLATIGINRLYVETDR